MLNNQSKGYDKFVLESLTKHGNRYDYSMVLYKNNKSKVEILCSKHGSFYQVPHSHVNGSGCPKCGSESASIKQRCSTDEFIEKSIKVHGDKYDYSLVNYINNNTKVKIICSKHGIFYHLPNNHLSGQSCGKCSGKSMSNDDFIKRCEGIHKGKYDYSLVKYTDMFSHIDIICPIHGRFSQSPNNHLNQKQGCPNCGGSMKSNTKEFIRRAEVIHKDRYDYSRVNYLDAKSPVLITCKKHGEFNQSPTHHLSSQGCPICKSSKGENKIFNILSKMMVIFEHHHKFNGFAMEFDFYLPKLNICIEYDGIQHFKPINHFGGLNAFTDQKRRDREKDIYCLKNNITLVRISYYDDVNKIIETISPLQSE